MGPIPGGELTGATADAPADWAHTAEVEVFQLETSPQDPYSVNIWGVAVDGAFYVAAGEGGDTRWANSLVADPRVRLRVGEEIYELSAELVADAAERTTARNAYVTKYALDPAEVPVDDFVLYRLDPRAP